MKTLAVALFKYFLLRTYNFELELLDFADKQKNIGYITT